MKRLQSLSFFVGIVLVIMGLWMGRESTNKPSTLRVVSPTPKVVNTTQPIDIVATIPTGKVLGKNNVIVSQGLRQVVIVQVLDGDTVITATGEKIRYLGINAPEKGQPFSSVATEANKELVFGRTVGIEHDIQEKDRYGRTLGYVYVGDILINFVMVQKGLAITETIQPNVKYQDLILEGQQKARSLCAGIWEGLCDEGTSNSTKGCMKILSIMANPPGDETKNKNAEYITIENSCGVATPMRDWLIKDNSASNKYLFGDFSLPSGGRVHLHSGCGQNTQTDLYWKCPEQKYAVWNNTGDHAFIYDDKGGLIADYAY